MKRDNVFMKSVRDACRKNPSVRVNDTQKCLRDMIDNRERYLEEQKKDVSSSSSSSSSSIPSQRRPSSARFSVDDVIKFDQKLVEMKGRVLPTFDIQHVAGSFRVDRTNRNFLSSVKDIGVLSSKSGIQNWAVICESSYQNQTSDLIRSIMNTAQKWHTELREPEVLIVDVEGDESNDGRGGGRGGRSGGRYFDRRHEYDVPIAWEPMLKRCIDRRKDLVLCVMPSNNSALYPFIKKRFNIDGGIISQCCIVDTIITKPVGMIGANLLKQSLVKRGYAPWTVDFDKSLTYLRADGFGKSLKSTMLVGIDISHEKPSTNVVVAEPSESSSSSSPPPELRRQSVAAFCASYDIRHSKYLSYVSIQPKEENFINESKRMMFEALKDFHASRKTFPEQVIVFREGVSENQMDTFVRREIGEFETAFTEHKISPRLTVIIVQKVNNIRFFDKCEKFTNLSRDCPTPRCDGTFEYHSPLPGTVIDSVVCSKKLSDFYLIPSNAPPNATAKPTRFIIVRDDIKLNMDVVQAFVNQLCYLYPNWPGPIRSPAPCMLSSKLAYMFAKHIRGKPHRQLHDKVFYI